MTETLLLMALLAVVINIPLGYLRRRTKKFSFKWALYIHLSIPLLIPLRVLAGISLWAAPIFILAAILGQFAGGHLNFR